MSLLEVDLIAWCRNALYAERTMNLTLTNVLTLAATTGIFTALLNQGIVWFRERQAIGRLKKSEANYLAIRLAVILEEFVVRCRNRAWHDKADLSEGRVELDYNLPKLAPYRTCKNHSRLSAGDST
jgi:hypothetical protein